MFEQFHCDGCNSPMMASPSGSVCPNGCGRFGGKMPVNVRRRNHAMIGLGAVDCVEQRDYVLLVSENNGQKLVDFSGPRYEIVKRISEQLFERPEDTPDDHVFALGGKDGTTILELAPAGSEATA